MPRFGNVIGQLPPYALARSTFPFPALAAQVGRAGLGGPREAVLGSLVVARLCLMLLPPYDISFEDAAARSTNAKNWLSSLTLGAGLRAILASVIDATGAINRTSAADALQKLGESASLGLDSAAREEMERLVADLRAKH